MHLGKYNTSFRNRLIISLIYSINQSFYLNKCSGNVNFVQ